MPALGFADDLNILSPNRMHAQYSADIVSAFNALAGLTTNIKKVKFGSGFTPGPPLILRNYKWEQCPIECTVPVQARILGIEVPLNKNWNLHRSEAASSLRKMLEQLQPRQACAGA
jgi:hypothetical protein